MKFIFSTFLLLIALPVYTSTLNVERGQVYRGYEAYNEHATGDVCYITIRNVAPLISKGKHCYSISYVHNSLRNDIPKRELTVDTRVTNYHRREYPTVKTCAMNVDGTTYGDEIYEDETDILYNQILGGQFKESRIRYDYFLTLEPDNKLITRARVHVMKLFSEYDVDCVNLEKL